MLKRQHTILLLALLCAPIAAAFGQSPSQTPRQESGRAEQRPNNEQSSPDQATIIIKVQNSTANAEKKSNANSDNGKENGWNRTDKIAGAAAFAGFLQFIALAITIGVLISTARRQLRAYVFPDTAGLWDGTTLNPKQPARTNIPGVVLTWKNTGQTPARNVVSWAQIAVIETIYENTQLIVPPLEQKFASVLGANGVNSKALWFNRVLLANEIADIGTGVRAIYLYGRIEYRDIFKKKRWSNFRLRYTGPFPAPPETIVFNTCEQGNEAK